MSVLLEVKDLSLQERKGTTLKDINFSLETHQIMSIVGPWGNRGEVLLRTLAGRGRLRRQGGKVIWAEDCRLGYVYQRLEFLEELSVFENLKLALKFIGFRSHTHLGEAVEKVLWQVNFWPEVKSYLHEPLKELNFFHKVKINLARSLLFKPHVLFLEDPTQFLDPVQIVEYENMIEKLKPKMSTIWLTTDLEQAARVSDTIAVMKEGRFLEFGSTMEVFTTPMNPETEHFITRRIYV